VRSPVLKLSSQRIIKENSMKCGERVKRAKVECVLPECFAMLVMLEFVIACHCTFVYAC
jgi:hypothetical protein